MYHSYPYSLEAFDATGLSLHAPCDDPYILPETCFRNSCATSCTPHTVLYMKSTFAHVCINFKIFLRIHAVWVSSSCSLSFPCCVLTTISCSSSLASSTPATSANRTPGPRAPLRLFWLLPNFCPRPEPIRTHPNPPTHNNASPRNTPHPKTSNTPPRAPHCLGGGKRTYLGIFVRPIATGPSTYCLESDRVEFIQCSATKYRSLSEHCRSTVQLCKSTEHQFQHGGSTHGGTFFLLVFFFLLFQTRWYTWKKQKSTSSSTVVALTVIPMMLTRTAARMPACSRPSWRPKERRKGYKRRAGNRKGRWGTRTAAASSAEPQ